MHFITNAFQRPTRQRVPLNQIWGLSGTFLGEWCFRSVSKDRFLVNNVELKVCTEGLNAGKVASSCDGIFL